MSSPPSWFPHRNVRGLSLVEAVLSAFLLLTSLLLAVYVFDSSLKWEAGNEKRVVAAVIAETALAEVREAGGRDFDKFLSYDGNHWTYPDYPGFEVLVRAEPTELATACTELESQFPSKAPFPDPVGKFLKQSAVKTTVTVKWNDPAPAEIEITENVVSFREVNQFAVKILDERGSAISNVSLNKNEIKKFQVIAYVDNREDRRVHDLQFTWFVEPITGFGSVNHVGRDGLECRYINNYRNYQGQVQHAFGDCNLAVQATYQGRVAKATVAISNVE